MSKPLIHGSDPADGRISGGRNLDQVQLGVSSNPLGFIDRDDPEIFIFRADQAHLRDANGLINPIIYCADNSLLPRLS